MNTESLLSVRDSFERTLGQLETLLTRIFESHHPETLLNARLVEDMLPLAVQVRVVSNFVLRGLCPLNGEPFSLFDEGGMDEVSLRKQLRLTKAKIAEMSFDPLPAQDDLITDTAGKVDVSLNPSAYLYEYIIPNLYFHMTLVYAIARAKGVSLSKGDFDGYHHYPAGFRFD